MVRDLLGSPGDGILLQRPGARQEGIFFFFFAFSYFFMTLCCDGVHGMRMKAC